MNLKAFLAILAALALVLAAGFLPRFTAAQQDKTDQDKILFAAVSGVQLDFDQGSDLTMRQTLAMMIHPQDQVEIPTELASMKQEKVERIAAAAVEKLFQTGILFQSPEEYSLWYRSTVLCYGPENRNNIFWQLAYEDPKGNSTFIFTIDDRTGTVCGIEFYSAQQQYDRDQMPLILERFTGQFLTGLGEEFVDVDVSKLMKNTQSPADGSYLAAEMTWQDPDSGACTIAFFVNKFGFYTYDS